MKNAAAVCSLPSTAAIAAVVHACKARLESGLQNLRWRRGVHVATHARRAGRGIAMSVLLALLLTLLLLAGVARQRSVARRALSAGWEAMAAADAAVLHVRKWTVLTLIRASFSLSPHETAHKLFILVVAVCTG